MWGMTSTPEIDEQFMRRAIRLAMNGRGRVEPNPMVGCVIVKERRVIGEGFHERYGGPHAEPNALGSCSESPEGGTAYVTLEPCCHLNKQTPPCVPRLIEAKVGRVVVGCVDPNPAVDGNGARQLRQAGIVVDGPVLEAECRQLIAPFIAGIAHHRPYVTLKWAQTADGKIAGPGGRRMQIGNQRSSRTVHALRSRSEVIIVGINTVLTDDPLLTARDSPAGANSQSLRVVLDSSLRISPTARLFAPGESSTSALVYHGVGGMADRIRELAMAGIPLRALPLSNDGRLSLPALLEDLYDEPTTHVLVESGPTLAAGFINDNLADRIWVFRSPKVVNDASAPSAVEIPSHYIETGRVELDGDVLTEYLNPRSPVFFAPEPSADLVLPRG
jgi:diaminohydroxyphosphoribosylaminopyrimidine deaminase/5-amino-6-(5-phosphoribosylamino)uracil reductase